MPFSTKIGKVFASPESALNNAVIAEKLLSKLQSGNLGDEEKEEIYLYLDAIFQENTQFFAYKIEELELLLDGYRSSIIQQARKMATNKEYKSAVEFLESKSEIFKDKSTINSLILNYSKYFVKDGLFYYDKTPKIIAINKLIAQPNFAFCEENLKSDFLDEFYLTSSEFQNLLNELYLNDYVLINLFDFVDVEGKIPTKKDLYLPLNKTPIILLMNNINFYDNEPWFIEKFIIDGKDDVACYNSKQPEKNQISYASDFIPILENFIKLHPDFSINGAKSVISFDKNGAILGYNINKTNPNCGQDTANLKKLVTKLKQLGYVFGYGNFEESFISLNFDDEIDFVKENLLPIFGTINVYISPFEKNKNNEFYRNLGTLGFKIFVDFNNFNFMIKNGQAFLSCKNFGGKLLRENFQILQVDFEKIYDHNQRTKLF